LKKIKNDSVETITQERLDHLVKLETEVELTTLKCGLPHIYLHPLYPWQEEYMNETNRQCWLTCANQIGKSSAQIIKCLKLATDRSLWKKFFPVRDPSTFYYFYPKKATATVEFHEKWKKTYLPKGAMKTDPVYGWKEDIRQKDIHSIAFNSGVTVYFMSYEMKDMQAVTVDAMFCDEEIPEDLYPEINARLFATNGPFSCVFTATIGQDWTKRIIEGTGRDRVFPDSWRRQVSMYDCQFYTDGSATKFTDGFIDRIKKSLPNDIEIQRRVFGKFVIIGGLVFPEYSMDRHFTKGHIINSSWLIYAGIDMGSGGEEKENHPAAISFVAVNPEHTQGRIFKTWRGDYVRTTATDILDKYIELSKGMNVVRAVYDYAGQGVDFGTIAVSRGIPVQRADKRQREEGIDLMNVLWKNNLLKIYDYTDGKKLSNELVTLKHETSKTKAKDDLIDSAKYIIRDIPWDWSVLNMPELERVNIYKDMDDREKAMYKSRGIDIEDDDDDEADLFLSEIREYNDDDDDYDDF